MGLFYSFICLLSASSLSISPTAVQVNKMNESTALVRTESTSPFSLLGGYPEPYKVLECDDGYVYYNLEIYKACYTIYSNLYLLHIESVFTPGYVANMNGDVQNNGNGYKKYMLKRGYVHIGLSRYEDDNRYGGTIYPKSMWPSSSTTSTTFTSSFGSSSTIGKSLGAGIELGNGGILSVTGNASNSSSLTFTYDESLSSVVSDPILSNQYSSSNNLEAQWSFEILNKDIAGKISYHLDSYYLFEMSNDAYNCNVDAFIIDYKVMFQGQYIGFLWATYEGWQFTSTVNVRSFI